ESLCVTSILSTTSSSTGGAGVGTVAPIRTVRCTPTSVIRISLRLRNRNAKDAAWSVDQLRRIHHEVGIRHAPERGRIAERSCGDHIRPVIAAGSGFSEQG